MPTIASENQKPIRQALTVLCGMDVNTGITASANSSSTYDGVFGNLGGVPVNTPLMDLSGDGFKNDGNAQPLNSDHIGIIGGVSTQGTNLMPLQITFSTSVSAGTTITLFYYTKGSNELKKEVVPMSETGTRLYASIISQNGRIHLVKISVGDSWWFNNDSLISCTVSLRGVETKAENPELQMSDIEIVGYEPNDVLNKISYIGDDVPIYYTCGYPGDMSPLRKFYLSEPIKWEKKQITIKGEDATKFLDGEYGGKFIGNYSGDGGGIGNFVETIHNMLNSAGVSHEYENAYKTGPYSNGEPAFIKNISKRSIISQAVNLFNFDGNWLGECGLVYVDAGRPRLIAKPKNFTNVYEIQDIAELDIQIARKIKRIEMNNPLVDRGPSESIETVNTSGTVIRSVSDPLLSVATNTGTVTLITPYSYKLKASGNAAITGTHVRFYDPSDTGENTPLIRERASGVETVVLNEFNGMIYGAVPPSGGGVTDFWTWSLQSIMDRPLKTFTFSWRGDPKLQPRDYIKTMIDGQMVNMTIESIVLNHEGGGLTSQIVAREGLI